MGKKHVADPTEEPLYTVAEVAELLRMNKFSVYRLVGAGRMPALKFGAAVRVPASSVRDYAKAREKTREYKWKRATEKA